MPSLHRRPKNLAALARLTPGDHLIPGGRSQGLRANAPLCFLVAALACNRPEESPAPIRATAARARALDCDSGFQAPLRGRVRLTRACSPYTVGEGRTLELEGAQVELEPGVELRLGEDASIEVGNLRTSRLVARGTRQAPIRFTGAGRWRHLALGRRAGGSVLEHVQLSGAGRDGAPALQVDAPGVTVRSVTFERLEGPALAQSEATRDGLAQLEGCDFTRAGGPEVLVKLSTESLNGVGTANKFPPGAVIELSGALTHDTRVRNPGVPYRYRGTLLIEGEGGHTAHVVFESGVVIQFHEDARILVGDQDPATLIVAGTAQQPVRFQRFGDDALPGSWRGVEFQRHARPPDLRHLILENAGTERGAALAYAHDKSLGALSDSVVRGTRGAAIDVRRGDDGFERFTGNHFERIAGPILSGPVSAASALGEGNTYPPGAAFNLEGPVDRDVRLTAQDAPYDLAGTVSVEARAPNAQAVLTVDAGARLRFGPSARLTVGGRYPGTARLHGTPEAPVVLEGLGAEPWRGIDVGARGKLEARSVRLAEVSQRKAITLHRGSAHRLVDVRRSGARLTSARQTAARSGRR